MKPLTHTYLNLHGGEWLRGNLHTHTDRSDGDRPLQAVIDDYADRGYAFLMIADHDLYTSAKEYAAVDSRGMVLIPGNEVTRGGPHLLHVNADFLVEPFPRRQAVIDAVAAGRGFIIANHPNWQAGFNHCPLERLREWRGYAGMEIFNGVIGRLDGSPYATDKWDTLLSEGRRVWGFANDDSHTATDAGLGWNVAYVTERTPGGVAESLRQGRFYASTGVVISGIEVEGRRVRLETENASRIIGLGLWGRRFAVVDDRAIEVEVPEDTPYARFECWCDGERFAWTQPLWEI